MSTLTDSDDQTVFPRRTGKTRAPSNIDSRQIGDLSAISALVAAANPLLMTASSLRTCSAPSSIDSLRSRLIEMVSDFDTACERLQVSEEQRHLARYAICTVLDETIQRSFWGGELNWAQHSLLIHFFKENWGGEKFFQILDKMVQSPAKYIDLLQLFYICLSLGFVGQFLLQGAAGRQAVAELRERLYHVMRQVRAEPDRTLSDQWQGLSVAVRRFSGSVAVWVTLASSALICLTVYLGFASSLYSFRTSNVAFKQVVLPAPVERAESAPTQTIVVKRYLRPLLTSDLESRPTLIKLDEDGIVSVVTIGFESSRSTPTPDQVEVLKRVAAAIEKIGGGRIVVSGHTDNVKPSSLRFKSNRDLSLARAQSVADVLRANMADKSYIAAEGVGEDRPYKNNSNLTEQDRTLNRRVDISLRAFSKAI